MKKPSSRAQKILVAATTPVALVVAATMVYQASYAAFSGQTRNSGNDWATGSVNLTDDDNGSARFQVKNMLPGATDSKCITVTANATVASTVRGYAVNPVVSTTGLEDHIKVRIESGDGGSFASCAGFVGDSGPLVPANTTLRQLGLVSTYAAGIGGWVVAPGSPLSKTYKLTWEFDTTGMSQSDIDKLQNSHTGIDMQWEMQSNG